MQISRRFGVRVIPRRYMNILLDYCSRGKVEHLIRMRERLDEHSRYLETQLAGLEALVKEKGESKVVVPALPERPRAASPLPYQQGGVSRSKTPSPVPMLSSTTGSSTVTIKPIAAATAQSVAPQAQTAKPPVTS